MIPWIWVEPTGGSPIFSCSILMMYLPPLFMNNSFLTMLPTVVSPSLVRRLKVAASDGQISRCAGHVSQGVWCVPLSVARPLPESSLHLCLASSVSVARKQRTANRTSCTVPGLTAHQQPFPPVDWTVLIATTAPGGVSHA
ncbi:hypothetical protein BO99DRAFT_97412 [Aspergillus violaceofuscus CBS 115571]|uniref:Uncharacterized protein n=1 Tax=Aspergillus violaceofuscus (strain CBS 115571) TaxID=1450538 RepID=A0A2V5HBS6_ASPV1|nr:hypothetical protein BO99DRAFT_97412 [Aspergillus violaceofuscus CBS 115571]